MRFYSLPSLRKIWRNEMILKLLSTQIFNRNRIEFSQMLRSLYSRGLSKSDTSPKLWSGMWTSVLIWTGCQSLSCWEREAVFGWPCYMNFSVFSSRSQSKCLCFQGWPQQICRVFSVCARGRVLMIVNKFISAICVPNTHKSKKHYSL